MAILSRLDQPRLQLVIQPFGSDDGSSESDVATSESEQRLSLQQLIQQLDLKEHEQRFAKPDSSVDDFVGWLIDEGFQADAIKVLVHSVSKQRAIEWAHQSVTQLSGDAEDDEARVALESCTRWLAAESAEDQETARRKALELAEASGFSTPSGCVAAAVGWSSGSMAGEEA